MLWTREVGAWYLAPCTVRLILDFQYEAGFIDVISRNVQPVYAVWFQPKMERKGSLCFPPYIRMQ